MKIKIDNSNIKIGDKVFVFRNTNNNEGFMHNLKPGKKATVIDIHKDGGWLYEDRIQVETKKHRTVVLLNDIVKIYD